MGVDGGAPAPPPAAPVSLPPLDPTADTATDVVTPNDLKAAPAKAREKAEYADISGMTEQSRSLDGIRSGWNTPGGMGDGETFQGPDGDKMRQGREAQIWLRATRVQPYKALQLTTDGALFRRDQKGEDGNKKEPAKGWLWPDLTRDQVKRVCRDHSRKRVGESDKLRVIEAVLLERMDDATLTDDPRKLEDTIVATASRLLRTTKRGKGATAQVLQAATLPKTFVETVRMTVRAFPQHILDDARRYRAGRGLPDGAEEATTPRPSPEGGGRGASEPASPEDQLRIHGKGQVPTTQVPAPPSPNAPAAPAPIALPGRPDHP